MYLDSVIVASIITIVVVCVILGYMGLYAYRHIKNDAAASKKQPTSPRS